MLLPSSEYFYILVLDFNILDFSKKTIKTKKTLMAILDIFIRHI